MAKAPNLSDITNVYTSATTINANSDRIEEAFQNTLSRDGSGPNQMNADLDMNSNDLLNVNDLEVNGRFTLNGAGININDPGLVRDWATNPEDIEVDPEHFPGEFSAYHYMKKAEEYAAEAGSTTNQTDFTDLPALLAIGFAPPVGAIVFTKKEGYYYEVVASAPHLTTTNGTMLRVNPQEGRWSFGALNPSGDGVADNRPLLVIADTIGGVMYLPKPTVRWNVATPIALMNTSVEVDPSATWAQLTGNGGITWSDSRGLTTTVSPNNPRKANIHRFSDRVFIGHAADHYSGNTVVGDGGTSWMKSAADGMMYPLPNSLLNVMASDTHRTYGIASAVKTKVSNSFQTTGNTIAMSAIVNNDDLDNAIDAWGYIAEIFHNTAKGRSYGIEVPIHNNSGFVERTSPYLSVKPAGETYGINLFSNFADALPGTSNPSTCAMLVAADRTEANANIGWLSGITFRDNAITGTDGSATETGVGEAIAMARRQAIRWYAPIGGQVGASLFSSVTTGGQLVQQEFIDSGVAFRGNNSAQFFRATHNADAVNYIHVIANPAGEAATVSSQGSDTNIDLRLTPKGTGRVRFGTFVPGSTPITGHIEIRDASGIIRKLAVVS